MAQRVNVVLVDDLDGSEAEETVTFGLDGSDYEIDLSSKNAAKLRDALAVYVAHSRRTGSRRRRGGSKNARAGSSPAEVREWGRANGYKLPDRGRIPAEVRAAYEAAH